MESLGEILWNLDDIGNWKKEFLAYESKIDNIFENVENKGKTFYPYPEKVFTAFQLTPLENVKVVIWGQDPYPTLLKNGQPRAQGYSFGVDKKDIIPASLMNIHKEIKENYPTEFKAPKHGDLRYLAKQGILFMNCALTYCPESKKDSKLSHINLWNRFVDIVIKILNKNKPNCIHVLWGEKCKKLAESFPEKNVLQSSHPSPLGAHKGFLGCKHFYHINIILDRLGEKQINWNEDPDLPPTTVKKTSKEIISLIIKKLKSIEKLLKNAKK